MAQASLTAGSFGAELRIHTAGASGDLDAFVGHDFWPQFVPGAELKADETEHAPDLNITFDSGADWRFDAAAGELTCPSRNILHAICTAGYMLEAKRQGLGMYTMHGNVISNGDLTVALLGPISGIGKTGLSSHAVNKGWQWISDEKFVMNDQGEYVGSVDGILQDGKTRQSAGNNEPGAANSYNRSIGAFVIPILSDNKTSISHVYDHDKAFWHLSEEMSRDVRMTPFALDGPDVPLPSLDTEELAIRRRDAAVMLSGKIPFISLVGTSDTILDYLSTSIR